MALDSGGGETASGVLAELLLSSSSSGIDARRSPRQGGGDNDAICGRSGESVRISTGSGRDDHEDGAGGGPDNSKKLGSFCIVVMGSPTINRVCTEVKESSVGSIDEGRKECSMAIT